VATIGRAVGHEASIIGSADMPILLGAALILALAIVFSASERLDGRLRALREGT